MPKSNFIPQKLRVWIDVRKKFKLSDKHIQMARELGLNPKKFGSLNNHRQEPWKAPLPVFIEDLYFKQFKKEEPETVKSIERIAKEKRAKKNGNRSSKTDPPDTDVIPPYDENPF